jgi:hypothetical protein
MERRLIADITFLDVHLQLWMLPATGIIALWFVYFRILTTKCDWRTVGGSLSAHRLGA